MHFADEESKCDWEWRGENTIYYLDELKLNRTCFVWTTRCACVRHSKVAGKKCVIWKRHDEKNSLFDFLEHAKLKKSKFSNFTRANVELHGLNIILFNLIWEVNVRCAIHNKVFSYSMRKCSKKVTHFCILQNISHPWFWSNLKATAKWWFSKTDSSLYINASSEPKTSTRN